MGPGDDPAEARVGYKDAGWNRVRLPHDGLAPLGASNVSCPKGCSGNSFIPRHVMWYRKSFSLPTGWAAAGAASSSVWVEFDGVFHSCIVFLNGAVVARNAEGYLGFRVPLDNATAGTNVIAVFVDPDGGAGFSSLNRSGWWYGEEPPTAPPPHRHRHPPHNNYTPRLSRAASRMWHSVSTYMVTTITC